ncbi:type II secretion system GspH family protein [Candidatus Parcubacteria bacterium]|nr:type II secretion system GspH family protein [Candidatus Parcubacteria bacterium]
MRVNLTKKSGFTLLEMMIVIIIMGFMIGLTMAAFQSSNKAKALEKQASSVLSIITQARSETLASRNDAQYGVHFDGINQTVTLYQGSTYDVNAATNKTESLNNYVQIASTNLVCVSGYTCPSSVDIVFDRLTGKANSSGTITLSLKADATQTKVITIRSTGIAESN